MRTLLRLSAVLSVLSMAAHAAIITAANCSASFGISTATQTSPSSCSVAADNGVAFPLVFANASIGGTQTISPANASIAFSFSTSTTASVGSGYSNDANVSASDNLTLYTKGPVRPGEAVVMESFSILGIVSSLTASLTLGSLTANCTQSAPASPSCSGSLGPSSGNGTFTIPFTLGQPFALDVSLFNDSSGGGSTPHFSTSGDVNLSVQLFESNGTTPVQILTPEPATLGFLTMGLVSLAAIRRRRNNRDV